MPEIFRSDLRIEYEEDSSRKLEAFFPTTVIGKLFRSILKPVYMFGFFAKQTL